MKKFYSDLKEALEKKEGDLWTETILEGDRRGEKRLIIGSPVPAEERDVLSPHLLSGQEEASVRLFRERVGRSPRLIICGGGHVSMPIIRMGRMLGFTVTVLEDRPQFADRARAAGADQVYCNSFERSLDQIRGDSDSWFVIVTRGHRYDRICLERILGKTCAYVGMMGSRRRVALVKEQLAEAGIPPEKLAEIYTPIGLKIGGETPEEIAVSVMAEIIQVKNAREKCGCYSKELMDGLLSEDGYKRVLATIISRKGSAPRGVGARMLIREDGATVDTIGGGCVESQIIQKALLMMRAASPDFQICRADLTADTAEEEGMVCGGVVEVMLELI